MEDKNTVVSAISYCMDRKDDNSKTSGLTGEVLLVRDFARGELFKMIKHLKPKDLKDPEGAIATIIAKRLTSYSSTKDPKFVERWQFFASELRSKHTKRRSSVTDAMKKEFVGKQKRE